MMTRADTDAHYLSPAGGFTELADTYDARFADDPLFVLENAAVLAALPDLRGARRVLDVGCGTGRYALHLSRLSEAEVVGIDLAPDMLSTAARKARRANIPVHWLAGDLTTGQIPVEDGSADAAICALTLSFLPDAQPALAAIARALAPGGSLVISDYHPYGMIAAQCASRARFARDRAPYVRFTSADGQECRIAQTIHTVADLFHAATATGLVLDAMAEPLVEQAFASGRGPALRDRIGAPLTLVMRFVKTGK
jgi:malonyl-CoA O-methyltransferase